MADDPNSTKPDSYARPRSPDHAHIESTSGTPRLTPTEPMWWPDDADVYGLIFLPRFVDKIGSRAFPDWAGTEVTLSEVDLLPELAEANNGDRVIASSLLRKHRPDLGQQDFSSGPWSAADNVRRHELWRIAQQLAEREYNAPPRCRLRRIKAEIRRQSCAGELPLKIRRVSGGPFEAFQPVWWNRDNPNELFDCCIIDPEYPFSERPSWKPNTDSWIFAPYEGIDQIAARLTARSEAEPQLSRSAIEVNSTELDPAAAHAQSAPGQPETPPPAPAADAAPKPIGPAATEPAAQSSLEVLASASPPPQEPTPTTPKTLPDTPEMILSVLGLKGFQQEAIAKAVLELYGRAPPESLTPGKLRKDLAALHKAQAAKAKARGDAPPAEPAKWDACKDFVVALRAWRARTESPQ